MIGRSINQEEAKLKKMVGGREELLRNKTQQLTGRSFASFFSTTVSTAVWKPQTDTQHFVGQLHNTHSQDITVSSISVFVKNTVKCTERPVPGCITKRNTTSTKCTHTFCCARTHYSCSILLLTAQTKTYRLLSSYLITSMGIKVFSRNTNVFSLTCYYTLCVCLRVIF